MSGMTSIKEIYKIGRGPSSSHTIGPERACKIFKEQNSTADSFRAILFGSLAKTGKGHGTDTVIVKTFEPTPCEIEFNMTDDNIINNTMQVFNNAFNNSVSSDGTFTVSLMYTDTEASTLDILITDEYSYGFMNRTGKTTCQRSIQLN